MSEPENEPLVEGIAWGSDVVAALLRELGIEHAALVPGASYRGLHDSIVNLLGNETPKMLLCLHEEHAVALAHGWAKVAGTPMLAIVHSNVGLLHASMAIFNAWCDRVPVLILGANGPLDAAKRRPFIDWIHTANDMGALVRPFTKWDDQPASATAAIESILRAHQLAQAAPPAPVYVCLDAAWQEERLREAPVFPPLARYAPPAPPGPTEAETAAVVSALRGARRPVMLVGRASRDVEAWDRRVALAEALDARVVTHLRAGAVFPTEHPLFAGHTAQPRARTALRDADVVLDLDCIDLAGVLRSAFGGPVGATVVSASLDRYLHRGGSGEHQALPPVDVNLAVDPDALVAALVRALAAAAATWDGGTQAAPAPALRDEPITMAAFSEGVAAALAQESPCYVKLPRGVRHDAFVFRHPLDFLGADGGGGVGSGPGLAVGAALALRESGRLPVLVTGDGDYLMGVTALWTAVANDIPLLVVVANNRSYYNDELHQEKVALARGRPPERRWIGQRLDEPAPDVAGFARAQGAVGIGPVARADALPGALDEAVRAVRAGRVAVVDVVVVPPSSSSDVGQRG